MRGRNDSKKEAVSLSREAVRAVKKEQDKVRDLHRKAEDELQRSRDALSAERARADKLFRANEELQNEILKKRRDVAQYCEKILKLENALAKNTKAFEIAKGRISSVHQDVMQQQQQQQQQQQVGRMEHGKPMIIIRSQNKQKQHNRSSSRKEHGRKEPCKTMIIGSS